MLAYADHATGVPRSAAARQPRQRQLLSARRARPGRLRRTDRSRAAASAVGRCRAAAGAAGRAARARASTPTATPSSTRTRSTRRSSAWCRTPAPYYLLGYYSTNTQSRRPVPQVDGAREAAGRRRARAPRLSGADRGRHGLGAGRRLDERRGRRATRRSRRRWRARSSGWRRPAATCPCACRPRRARSRSGSRPSWTASTLKAPEWQQGGTRAPALRARTAAPSRRPKPTSPSNRGSDPSRVSRRPAPPSRRGAMSSGVQLTAERLGAVPLQTTVDVTVPDAGGAHQPERARPRGAGRQRGSTTCRTADPRFTANRAAPARDAARRRRRYSCPRGCSAATVSRSTLGDHADRAHRSGTSR